MAIHEFSLESTPRPEDYDLCSLESLYNLSPEQTLEEQADEPLEFTKFGTLAARAEAATEIVTRYNQDSRVIKELNRYKNNNTPTKSPIDPLGRYLEEIGQYDRLDKATTIDLYTRIEKGMKLYQTIGSTEALSQEEEEVFVDTTIAWQKVYLSNLRLAAHKALKYERAELLPALDMINEANIGLASGVSRYDITKGFEFSTYATTWIEHDIRKALSEQSRLIRIPRDHHDDWLKTHRTERKLTSKLDREPTIEETASESGMTIERVEELRRIGKVSLISLNQPRTTHITGVSEFQDFVPDSKQEAELETVTENEEIRSIFTNSALNDTAKLIISLHFGVLAENLKGAVIQVGLRKNNKIDYDAVFSAEGYKITKISETIHIHPFKVRKILEKALADLRKSSTEVA